MKPLETSQRVMKWLYAFPKDEYASPSKRIAYFAFASIIFISSILSVTASTVFILKNLSINLEDTLFSLFHNIGALVTVYQSIATILLRHKLMAIFNDLLKIYDQSKH